MVKCEKCKVTEIEAGYDICDNCRMPEISIAKTESKPKPKTKPKKRNK